MTFLEEFGSKGVTDPAGIVLVLEMIKGAGAVDKQAAGLEYVPDVLYDLALTLPAMLYILQAPLLNGNLVLAEHSFA